MYLPPSPITPAHSIAPGAANVDCNGTPDYLLEQALGRGEGVLTPDGALSVRTGPHTGRSASDKFIVRDETTSSCVWWESNQPVERARFDALATEFFAHAGGRTLFRQDLLLAPGSKQPRRARVFTETAWHSLFIRNLVTPDDAPPVQAPDITVLALPSFRADPKRHGVRSETVIALDLSRNLVLIGGTAYSGEIKKALFSVFNFHAPQSGILPMHCAANMGANGETALFFGLSGTGKTTLSTSGGRRLIGDDEHGWDEGGIFNLEGGCYAKTADLSATGEPEIFAATKRAGTVLENVMLDDRCMPDFADTRLTENGRAAYPLAAIPNRVPGGARKAPSHILFLSADAFGLLPPIARLSEDQAVRFFIAGYTAKLAGTERGVTEPQATFSACFGAPFMARHPNVYARLLLQRLDEARPACWLVNTGWAGGAYGDGERLPLAITRRLVEAALAGEIDGAPTRRLEPFGLAVPQHVAGVPDRLLDPRSSWPDRAAYEAGAARLQALFSDQLERIGDGQSVAALA